MASAALTSMSSSPVYVGKSTLVLVSNRSPVEEAPMAVGYATLFNDPATIARLRATHDIPRDVTFEARTVAASPILTIEAIAQDPETAQMRVGEHGYGVPR